jgi:dihydrofolate reductase
VRDLYLQMQISLDGFVATLDGGVDWVDHDPVMGQAHMELARHADLTLMGHEVGRGMAGFWPGVETDPSFPESERPFARLMNEIPKQVISTVEEDLGWSNATQLLAADEAGIVDGVQALKEAGDGYLLLYGGIRTARTMLRHGLVDELHLDVPPVVLGEGLPLFETRQRLEQVSTTRYESGAVGVVYRPLPD